MSSALSVEPRICRQPGIVVFVRVSSKVQIDLSESIEFDQFKMIMKIHFCTVNNGRL